MSNYNYRQASLKRRHLSTQSSARTSRYGTRHPSADDSISNSSENRDQADGLWNEEAIPLLQRTVDRVRLTPVVYFNQLLGGEHV